MEGGSHIHTAEAEAPAAAGKAHPRSQSEPAGTPRRLPSRHCVAAAGTRRRDSWYTGSPRPTAHRRQPSTAHLGTRAQPATGGLMYAPSRPDWPWRPAAALEGLWWCPPPSLARTGLWDLALAGRHSCRRPPVADGAIRGAPSSSSPSRSTTGVLRSRRSCSRPTGSCRTASKGTAESSAQVATLPHQSPAEYGRLIVATERNS